MARFTKFQQTLQGRIKKASPKLLEKWRKDPRLRELIDSIMGTHKAIAISDVKRDDIRDVLGVDLASVSFAKKNTGVNWEIPAVDTEPSDFFVTHIEDLGNYYDAESEPMTRSFLDAHILEVMRNLKESSPQKLRVFGEMALNATKGDTTLSGFGDWFLAYGERDPKDLANVSLVGEAKSITNAVDMDAPLFQALTYMLIIHNVRKEKGKDHPRVFGFLTNRRMWIFLKIEDDGVVYKSKLYLESSSKELLGALVYVFQQAQLSSTTTTPFSSSDDIASPLTTQFTTSGAVEIQYEVNTMGRSYNAEEELSSDWSSDDDAE
ncbi:hypothetical protein HDU85_002551 [Gaertneriomyces sp. JEL0708]|nr:hypothetical protein HDU85_002551 [Gaertneriomyces sp. JEL0708]